MAGSTKKAPSISERAGRAILALLEKHPDGLTTAELIELGRKTIPGNKRGFYVSEGLSWLRGNGHDLNKDGRKHVLKK